MSKSFKKVATIIGIAAIGFATFGIGTLLLAGTTLASATAFAGYGLALGTILQLGLGALSIGTSPSPSIDDTGANDRGTAFYDPDAPACYVFGRTTLPASVVAEISDPPPLGGLYYATTKIGLDPSPERFAGA